MTNEELDTIIDATFDAIRALRATKGADYARDTDTLANFKRHAAGLDLTPEQVWAVYAGKHWDAVMTYCKRGQVESEPIEGRIDDLLTYLLLLKGLVVEAQGRNPLHEHRVPVTHMAHGAVIGGVPGKEVAARLRAVFGEGGDVA